MIELHIVQIILMCAACFIGGLILAILMRRASDEFVEDVCTNLELEESLREAEEEACKLANIGMQICTSSEDLDNRETAIKRRISSLKALLAKRTAKSNCRA